MTPAPPLPSRVESRTRLEAIVELIEVVPMTRGEEVVGGAHHLQDEVAGGAGLAGGDRAMMEDALAMLVEPDLSST